MKMATEREVTLTEFRHELNALTIPRRIDEVIVHHTWSPTAAQYRGIETVRNVRRYHMEERGWSDNGYHVMIGPDGKIFMCRPLSRAGAHTEGHNAHSVGVAFIANFDEEEPEEYGGMDTGLRVVAELLERFHLESRDIHFHREFAPKTCPGTKLQIGEFRTAVERVRVRRTGPARLVVLLPGYENTAVPIMVDGQHYVSVRDVARLFDLELVDHRAKDGKLYLKPREEGDE